ncbi:MAG: hypothetical protein HY716_16005 [Planctomycetes bacterium]|nr:hypothetical protein [Planctomycetota bacterium]
MGQWFFPSHDALAYRASLNEHKSPTYSAGPWRPISFAAGFATSPSPGGGVGLLSPSLHHRTHLDREETDHFRHHEWTHVIYAWNTQVLAANLIINGQTLPRTDPINVHPKPTPAAEWLVSPPEGNLFRIGEPSRTMEYGSYSRNWAADATVDEFYLWKGRFLESAQELYFQSRYHCPRIGHEGIFTSKDLPLTRADRVPAPPSKVQAPGRNGETQTADASLPSEIAAGGVETHLIAAAWTWYPERMEEHGFPQARDRGLQRELPVQVSLTLLANGVEATRPLTDDGGSLISGFVARGFDRLNYRIQITIGSVTPDCILHGTPIIDDVSLYFTRGVEFLAYQFEEFRGR